MRSKADLIECGEEAAEREGLMPKEPEWKTIRHGRLSVKMAGFDSDEELFAFLSGKDVDVPASARNIRAEIASQDTPMAWYLDQLGDA